MSVGPKTVLLLVGLLVATGAATWFALRCLRALRHTLRVLGAFRRRGRRLAELRPGTVALRGRAAAIDPLVAEESGRRGVYVAHSADRWVRSTTMGGLSGQWMRAAQEEAAAPFDVTDGERSVLVEPEGATFALSEPPTVVTEAGGAAIRYREAVIEDGDEVVVVGTARERGGFASSSEYRGHSYRLVIGRDPDGRVPLTVVRPQGMLGAFVLQALLRAAGVLPALACAGFTLGVAGSAFPLVRVDLPGQVVRDSAPPRGFHAWWGDRVLERPGVEVQGVGTIEIWCLATCFEVGRRIHAHANHELWRRDLHGLAGSRRERQRRYLVFDTVRERGTAFRLTAALQRRYNIPAPAAP